ncbi:MAG: cation diffusion facilitator family transporter [Rhodospirillales bacterium]|nr:cation diffusion facilitator family transporter [Rhodospirillales bacterium]
MEPAHARRLMRRATSFAVAAAALMIAAKLGAWLVTDSVSLLSSLADSVMDVLASLINLFAVRQALQPPDREHRFGHGKAEPLAGLGQALFITASAIFLIVEAAGRIMEPEPIARAPVGIAVMVFAIVVTTALVAYQRRVVRLTGSTAIRADSLHYASDILMNIGVIAALALAMTVGWGLADPIIAIAIAGVIVHAAVRVGWGAIQQLMDHELPEKDRERIRRIVLEHPEVLDCHDLRTRRSGIDSFIQVHVEMDRSLTLLRAHEISDDVETRIREAFPHAEVLIHADPEGIEEPMPSFARR